MHRNGLKVIRMQPEINRLHIKHFGDKDAIAEGQAALYKREKYNPLASLIPLAIQIIILMGVIEVIYHPLTYLLGMSGECVGAWLEAGQKLRRTGINKDVGWSRLEYEGTTVYAITSFLEVCEE